jgi:hypothetical protein
MMTERNRRLQLRYYQGGQFTFTRFDTLASDAELYEIARQLNTFQEDEAEKVLRVQVFEYMP